MSEGRSEGQGEAPGDRQGEAPGETPGERKDRAGRKAVGGVQGPVRSTGGLAARGAWISSGITFFTVGVVFTLTMPGNIALGITFLGLGVVFFSLAGTRRAPGDGPDAGSGSGAGSGTETGTDTDTGTSD